jgi:N-acetylmuramic acid 6-phosphate (MurNAc-6-P) etherase
MVELAAGVSRAAAVQAMRDAGGNVKLAAVMAGKRLSLEDARELLNGHGGNLRKVLET